MGKPYSPLQLLSVADFFETKALFFLAGTALPTTSNNVMDYPNRWLMLEIVRLTQCPRPTLEQWKSWLDTNQTVIGSIGDANWRMLPPGQAIQANGDSYITKSPEFPLHQFDVTSQSILRASIPIPQLWLWTGKTIKGKIYHPAIAQDAWLIEAMTRILPYIGSEKEIKVFEFVKKNKSVIDKIRSSFAKYPQKIGEGSDGVAFDIGQDRILKIFRDRLSFTKSMEAMTRLHKQPQVAKTEAMIYDAGLIGKFQTYDDQTDDVYYSIMEKMTPIRSYYGVDEEVKKVLKYIAVYIRSNEEAFQDLKQQMRNPEEHSQVKQEVARIANNMAGSLMARSGTLLDKIEDKIPTLRRGWLTSYIEEIIVKYITGRGDLHMGNLGVTSYGDLRYYDPAHNDWIDEINAPGKNSESESYSQRNTKQSTSESNQE